MNNREEINLQALCGKVKKSAESMRICGQGALGKPQYLSLNFAVKLKKL